MTPSNRDVICEPLELVKISRRCLHVPLRMLYQIEPRKSHRIAEPGLQA